MPAFFQIKAASRRCATPGTALDRACYTCQPYGLFRQPEVKHH
nr:hypothetical protein [Escherichia coli]